MKTGYIQVYTGDGKGKTTAAIGLSIRAFGAGLSVWFGQFIKLGDYSEVKALGHLDSRIKLTQFGSGRLKGRPPTGSYKEQTAAGFSAASEAMAGGRYDVVVLDEVLVAVQAGLIDEPALLEIMDSKPPGVELVLTGRGASEKVIERADLVTDMSPVKHYWSQGVTAREGIEK